MAGFGGRPDVPPPVTVEVDDAAYTILNTDEIIAMIAMTASRILTLPTPDGIPRVFTILDQSEKPGAFPIVLDPAGAVTINGLASMELTVPRGAIQVYSNGSSYSSVAGVGISVTGQVKINDGNSLKPTLVDPAVFTQIVYASVLGISAYPTTKWPQNVDVPVDGDVYDFVNDTFLENLIPGQVHMWRVILSYSGKAGAQDAVLSLRVQNTLSGFVEINSKALDKGSTSGDLVFTMTTIADAASLPAPFGTGQGYEFSLLSDEDITLVVESITRFSEKTD